VPTTFILGRGKIWIMKRFIPRALADGIARWSMQVVEFGVSQGIAQTAGMLSGLIYVRVMPVDQYALYAMALTAMQFVSVGSDMGLTGSLGYSWRQSGGDAKVIAPKIAAVRGLRYVFLAIAIVIGGALLLKTAAEQKLSFITVATCFGLAVATVWPQLSAGIDHALMRMAGLQRESYYCEVASSIARLLAALAMIVTGITTALFALAGGLLGSLSFAAAVRLFAPTSTHNAQPTGSEARRAVLAYVIPQLPTTVVYMVQDPLILWLALTFGGKAPLAETFAVGRIGALYGLIGIFIGAVIAPKLTRISDDAHFARMVALCLLALVLLSVAMTMIAYFAPSALLLLIGPKYAHLHREVVLSIMSSSLGLLLTLLAMANRLRGWVRLEPVTAGCQLVAICALASQWSFDNSESVLWLMVVLTGLNCLWFLITSLVGLFAPALVRVA
jgi:O-antigen/teichoic acid export membrane protein